VEGQAQKATPDEAYQFSQIKQIITVANQAACSDIPRSATSGLRAANMDSFSVTLAPYAWLWWTAALLYNPAVLALQKLAPSLVPWQGLLRRVWGIWNAGFAVFSAVGFFATSGETQGSYALIVCSVPTMHAWRDFQLPVDAVRHHSKQVALAGHTLSTLPT
jgi:hypothetical protein